MKTMSPLSDQQRATVIELLDQREQSLESAANTHLDQLRGSSVPEALTPAGDIADLAEIELVREHENAVVTRDLRDLRDIEAARERLDAEDAGACIECGEPIGFERLLALPTASRCISCQAMYEQSHQRAPDSAADGA
jgi:RNA polymerase-binding protein DksA